LKIDVELHSLQDLDTAMSLTRAHELRAKVATAVIIEASSSEKSSVPTGQLQGIGMKVEQKRTELTVPHLISYFFAEAGTNTNSGN
jgi:hypothetical protein